MGESNKSDAVQKLAQTMSSATPAVLHEMAAKHNIKIRTKAEEEAYLLVLQSNDIAISGIYRLPEYIDPRLAAIPTRRPRKWWKSAQNSHNAWSHVCELQAEKPISGLLLGRRIVVKDNISVAGLPYTCGMLSAMTSKDGVYRESEIDATVVQRLLEAGATIAGTATCENYSLTPFSYTSANGPVSNPWLAGYTTGGSSSGSACLLALGIARAAGVQGLEQAGEDVDLAMGGDQAGSIRLPASYCGFYGLKPTFGLVPYTGIAGLHPMIDHTGPMARKLEDIALMLTVLAGYDGLDARMSPESPLRQNVKQYHEELAILASSPWPGKSLRVGIILESLTVPGTNPEVAKVVQEAASKCFSSAGAVVAEVSIPMHLIGYAIWAAAVRPQMADLLIKGRVPDVLTHTLPHFAPRWPVDQDMYDRLTHLNPAVLNTLFSQSFLDAKFGPEILAKAHRHVLQLQAAYDKALEEFDVLITPTTPDVAPPLPDMRPESEGGSSLMDKNKLAFGVTNNTSPFNATGHPAMNVPCGWATAADGRSKLPVGMQIIGKRWDEMTVLKAAKTFELGGGGLGVWPGPN